MSVKFNKSGIIDASGIEVGENLLLKTNQGTTYWNWSGNGGTRTLTSTPDGGVKMVATAAANSGSWSVFGYQDNNIRNVLRANTNYTCSVDIKPPVNATMRLSFLNGNGTQGMTTAVDCAVVANKWNHAIWHFRTNTSLTVDTQEVYITGIASTVAGYEVYFKNLKIELGDNATPWIPNQADYGFVPTFHGFAESGDMMKVYSNHIETNEFIEF